MPTFGDQLTSEDIEANLEFIKASREPQERAYQNQVTEMDQVGP